MGNKSHYCAALYRNGNLAYEFHYRTQWQTNMHCLRWTMDGQDHTALSMRDGLYVAYYTSSNDAVWPVVRNMTNSLLRKLLPAETVVIQNDLHFARFGHVFPYRA